VNPLILHADHLIPISGVGFNQDPAVLSDGAVLVSADGRIEAVGTATDLVTAHPGVPVKRLADRLLMPGLINAHMHSGLLRGTAEGLPVWEWLQEFIDPMHRVLTPAEAEVASYLCYAESLLAGTTCVVDM
jgi:5-methylthioadenosine/S-adenosylhomocysteine deaminase